MKRIHSSQVHVLVLWHASQTPRNLSLKGLVSKLVMGQSCAVPGRFPLLP